MIRQTVVPALALAVLITITVSFFVLGSEASDDQPTNIFFPVLNISPTTGLTWGVSSYDPEFDMSAVSCYGHPQLEEGCNAYVGETSCSVERPILCLKIDGSPRPPYALTAGEYYRGWAEGVIALTEPIEGSELISLEYANDICVQELGEGYRMAEHHDGRYIVGMDEETYYGDTWDHDLTSRGGWTFFAHGEISNDSRFWVAIDDQPANCWDR